MWYGKYEDDYEPIKKVCRDDSHDSLIGMKGAKYNREAEEAPHIVQEEVHGHIDVGYDEEEARKDDIDYILGRIMKLDNDEIEEIVALMKKQRRKRK